MAYIFTSYRCTYTRLCFEYVYKLVNVVIYISLTYQNLPKSRVPINAILGFIIRTYKKVGFGRLR